MFPDLPTSICRQCRELLDAEIQSVLPIGGGDISQARLLETSRGRFFIKLNRGAGAVRMFATEAKGLELLSATKTLQTPQVIGWADSPDGNFLLLEYIETSYRSEGFWEEFGTALAALHRHTSPHFGLDHDNFIGSLPQRNGLHSTWTDFFIHERLGPQLDLALETDRLQSADARLFEKLYPKLPDICPAEPPSLTHGDLWSGNFLVGAGSHPVLIDPAVSYAHRETDLAMSRLFGGFERPFYRSYEAAWPLAPGFEQRLPVFQLYYLMVHLNLFGGGYAGSVRSILRRFAG